MLKMNLFFKNHRGKTILLAIGTLGLNWGCTIITPWYGTFIFQSAASNVSNESGCNTMNTNFSQKHVLRLDHERITVEQQFFDDAACLQRNSTQRSVYKYRIQGSTMTKTVSRDALGNYTLGTAENEVNATKLDYLRESHEITCFTNACTTTPVTNLLSLMNNTNNMSGGFIPIECQNIILEINTETDVTACALATGALTTEVRFELFYYNEKTRLFYTGSPYADPTDNQPGGFTGTSSATRPKYIDIDKNYLKISDSLTYGM